MAVDYSLWPSLVVVVSDLADIVDELVVFAGENVAEAAAAVGNVGTVAVVTAEEEELHRERWHEDCILEDSAYKHSRPVLVVGAVVVALELWSTWVFESLHESLIETSFQLVVV